MKSQELIETAINAGLSYFGPIKYRVKNDDWRYNVGLWTGQVWSFDCLGFVHCLVNGFTGDKAKLGGGAVMDKFVTSTTEIKTLEDYTYDISADFREMTPGELVYMPGHVGLYVGNVQPFDDGRVFNVAECCYSSFGGGGMLTYVTDQGVRLNHRNGSSAGYWTRHGKFYRVDYTDAADPGIITEDLKPADVLNLANDVFVGKWGNNPEREKAITEKYGKEIYRKVQDIMNILYK